MKQLYASVLFCLTVLTASSQYTTNGTSAASLGNNTFRLTSANQNQAGSVWYNTAVNLANDFILHAEMNFGSNTGTDTYPGNHDLSTGADGIAFVLQSLGTSAVGDIGEGIGYGGLTPSFAVEFDTWQNDGLNPNPTNRNDPAADHMAFMKNGDVTHNTAANSNTNLYTLTDLEDGMWHPVTIQWNATTKMLSVTLDGGTTRSFTGDLSAIIGSSNVYWGFTAATGGAYNEHQVRFPQSCTGNVIYCGNKNNPEKKVMVCHVPPGNTGNKQAICVSWSAVPAHLAHGDCLGDCSGGTAGRPNPNGVSQIDQNDETGFASSVYPNPSRGSVDLRLAPTKAERTDITIVNARGVVVERKSVSGSTQQVHLELKKYGVGLYLVKIQSGSQMETQKIMVQE